MYRVMVVDDEATITTQLKERLTLMGYEITGSASSGQEAAEMARRTRPDIVLMDKESTYLFMNEGSRMRLGQPLEEIIGKRYSEFH